MEMQPFSPVYGNETQIRYLSEAVRDGALPHAMVLEGDEGSGKKLLAGEIACALSPGYSEKIREGICPDVMTFSCEEGKKTIGVDSIRLLKESAALAPNDLDHKVFVIDGADKLTVQAQNALLKILEEPPAGVYLFLLCESVSSLLPTVLSRVVILRMQTFSDEELLEYFADDKAAEQLKEKSPDAFAYALRSSGGCIGGVKKKLGSRALQGSMAIYEAVCGFFRTLAGKNRAEFYLSACQLADTRDGLAVILTGAEEGLRDMIYGKGCLFAGRDVDAGRLLFFLSAEEAEELAGQYPMEALMKLSNELVSLHESLGANVNLKTALTGFAAAAWADVHSA